MSSSTPSVTILSRLTLPQLRLWAFAFLCWAHPTLACYDCAGLSTTETVSYAPFQSFRNSQKSSSDFNVSQYNLFYGMSNSRPSMLTVFGYLRPNQESHSNLSPQPFRIQHLLKQTAGKEALSFNSAYVSSASLNEPSENETASLAPFRWQTKQTHHFYSYMQPVNTLLEKNLFGFMKHCNLLIINTICQSLSSRLHFYRWLEIHSSHGHLSRDRIEKASSTMSRKLKEMHPTSGLIQKRRYFRGKARPRQPREEFVYGRDDRRRIPPLLMLTFPYSNVVRLSTGCTGTLLTPLHVLTAAHCVHNGHGFRENLEMMRVEVPDLMGVRIFYIEKISIPSRWRHRRSMREHQQSWDYALVTLIYGVHGRSRFYPLVVPTAGMLENDLLFLAFMKERDGHGHLWKSKCPWPSNKPLMDRSLIFTHCDSAVGNSGAAIIAKDDRSRCNIIGVLSSTIQLRQTLPPRHSISATPRNKSPPPKTPTWSLSFSVITALTWPKLWDICRELGREGIVYGVCPKPQYIPVKNRHLINTIPFFG